MELRDPTDSKVKRASVAVNNVNTVVSNYIESTLGANINASPSDVDMHMVKTLDGTSNEWG